MKPVPPCLKCNGFNFWRSSQDQLVRCATCQPPSAHYIIAERLRATEVPPSKLRSAQRFILLALKDAERIDARTVIDAAMREKIASPATLVRARQALGLRAVETRFGTRSGWVWVRPPH